MLATRTHQGIYGSLIIAIAGLLASLALASPVAADGNGSPAACETAINLQGNQNQLTYTAPAGQVVTGVCIKSGQELGHTGVLGNGSYDGNGTAGGSPACYTVSGVGGGTVTVTRIGSGSSCQGLSHVDVMTAPGGGNTGGGGNVTLCHMEGGVATLITVPANQEAAHRAHGDVTPTAGACPTGSNPGGSGTAGGSGTLGGQGGPARGAVAGGQGGPGAGSLPNTAVPADLPSSIGGALLVLSGIGFTALRRIER
jgi:hypothetical protein